MPARMAAVIENVGRVDLEDIRSQAGVWVVDSKDYAALDQVVLDGNMTT